MDKYKVLDLPGNSHKDPYFHEAQTSAVPAPDDNGDLNFNDLRQDKPLEHSGLPFKGMKRGR